ncbi:hypothetical protein DFH05DRAFT_1465017 [Lentinula detonsa]|uniref:Galactose-binding like protein n=1 Tax=Lentinula detonsa TaxID=2804962 RepID=A0A9W8U2A3_9AGAR|nr:hypothetical protein DFH05DRAFT_1465017 [Lentinula detonsa]
MNKNLDNPLEMVSLISPDTLIKVSSTLDKSVGKKNLIDGSPETCWTSQQGLPQTITLTFPLSSSSSRGVIPKTLSLTFQGGFVGRTCAIHFRPVPVHLDSSEKATWTVLKYVYPEDVNRRQTFTLPTPTVTTVNSALSSSSEPSTPPVTVGVSALPSASTDGDIEPEDIINAHPTVEERLGISALKLTFETSSDFFGRVTIYDLELKGYRLG